MKVLNSSLLCLLSFFSIGQAALDEARQLIAKGQYHSAYNLLDRADPKNDKPHVLALKVEIALDYHLATKKHREFAFSNIEPSENLMAKREIAKGSYSFSPLKVDSLIKRQLAKKPDHFRLHYMLGRYYQELYMHYGDSADIPGGMLLKFMEMHFRIAFNNGLKESLAAYGIGFAKLNREDYSGAIPYLKESCILDSNYVPAHYNLAYAFMQLQRKNEAIFWAKKAFQLYEDSLFKADVARMIALSYKELDSLEPALLYYRLSDSLAPNNYYSLKSLLQLEANLDSTAFVDTRLRFFQLGTDKAPIYQDLLLLHRAYGWDENLLLFFQEQLKQTDWDLSSRAHLHLYSAILEKDLGKEELWPKELSSAKKAFKALYPADHKVFVFIKSYFKASP